MGCLVLGDAWSRGGLLLGGGGVGPGPGGEEGGVISQHALRQTPPVNRMTNRCKNITLPQTSFAGGKNMLRQQKDIVLHTCFCLNTYENKSRLIMYIFLKFILKISYQKSYHKLPLSF